jgi:hypothetical protein
LFTVEYRADVELLFSSTAQDGRHLSGTGHLFVWTVLGRQATDGTIELVSLTIEWLDGRDVLPNDL